MIAKLVGIALFAVVTGVLGYRMGRVPDGSPQLGASNPTATEPTDAHIYHAQVASALLRIEQRLTMLEGKQAELSPRPSASELARESADSHGPAEQQEGQDREAGLQRDIEKRLRTESPDLAWAPTAEANLRAAARAAAGEQGVYSVDSLLCLTSICKIELVVPNLTGPQGQMQSLPFRVKDMAGYQMAVPAKQSDGTYRIAYKFFRNGHPRPGDEE